MSIDVDRETERLIESEVAGGQFENAEAFVGAAVRYYLDARNGAFAKKQLEAMIIGCRCRIGPW